MVLNTAGARPWSHVDHEVAAILAPTIPDLTDRLIDTVSSELPLLGQDLRGAYGVALRAGIHNALEHFLVLLGDDAPALDSRLTDLYRSYGARESRHDRSMEALLTAYHLGARGSWVCFGEAAQSAGRPATELIRLAEAVFAYIDELTAASTLGYAQAQLERAGERDRVRRELAEAILAGGSVTDAARVDRLARQGGWDLPDSLAVAIAPRPRRHRAPILHPDVLVLVREEEWEILVPGSLLLRPDPWPSILGSIEHVVVGTVRPLAEAPSSLAHARAVRRLVAEGVVPPAAVVTAADHLPELILYADRQLLADLTRRCLAPLAKVSAGRRAVLAATLRVWLARGRDRTATARDLDIHPQTVSYRLADLRRLFGPALEDPREQFAVRLALEAESRTW